MKHLIANIALYLLASLGSPASHAQERTPEGGQIRVIPVGLGVGCEFPDIQSAVDSASTLAEDFTIIRLTRDVVAPRIVILNRQLAIDGRWQSCTSTQPQAGLRRIIQSDGNDGVLVATVNDPNAGRILMLSGLVLRGGEAVFGGGGVRINSRISAGIFDTLIGDNESPFGGGGIDVSGTDAEVVLDEGTIVGAVPTQGLAGNRVTGVNGSGAGIRCVNARVVIRDARIRSNVSQGNGGGISASNCQVRIEPRAAYVGVDAGQSAFVTLFENRAALNGGGLFADQSSVVTWTPPTGSNDFVGRATGNRAELRGGAVFLQGGSVMFAQRIRIEGSLADDRGGAIAVQDAASAFVFGNASGHSCAGGNCQGIFGTRGISGANTSLIGGAVYAQGGAFVSLYQTQIHDNWAANGSAVHASGSATLVELDNTLVAYNMLYGPGNGTSTIEATSSADLTLRHVTMAQNFRASNQFPFVDRTVSSIRANGNSSQVILRNSILWNDGQQLLRLLVGAGVTGRCTLGHENATVFFAVDADPRYISTTAANPDFRLQENSPAIDRCGVLDDAGSRDLFGRVRPVDQPGIPNGTGAYDAGAIEMPLFNDLIFADSFDLLNVPEGRVDE